jgi:hypothetical protein
MEPSDDNGIDPADPPHSGIRTRTLALALIASSVLSVAAAVAISATGLSKVRPVLLASKDRADRAAPPGTQRSTPMK